MVRTSTTLDDSESTRGPAAAPIAAHGGPENAGKIA